MNKAIDIAAVLALVSLLVYAFTGLHFWAPINGPEDFGRGLVLFFAHVVPLFVAGVRWLAP